MITFDDLSLTLARYPVEAHHPACKFHDNHIIKFHGKEYCLGCSCLNLGCLLALPIFLMAYYFAIDFTLLMGTGILLYLPTLLQVKLQWKPFKLFSRTSLGVGSGIFMLSCMLLSPLNWVGFLIRIAGIVFFIVVAKMSLKFRSHNDNSPCINCQEGSFPYCSYKLEEMENIAASGTLEDLPQNFLISTIAKLNN